MLVGIGCGRGHEPVQRNGVTDGTGIYGMKKYEGLFILNLAGREESLKDVIDRVTAELTSAGCTVETVQKMDRRTFARTANKKVTGGYYVNFIFSAENSVVPLIRNRFVLDQDVYRVLITNAPAVTPSAPVAATN
jgi:ribosomal protein S6